MPNTTLGSFGAAPVLESAKTANYTITAADNGTLFTNSGAGAAVVFTLPTLAAGLSYEFFVAADQSITVASAAGDDMVAFNDASADSVALSTSSRKLGASLRVQSNAAGDKWLCFPMIWNIADNGGTTTKHTIAT